MEVATTNNHSQSHHHHHQHQLHHHHLQPTTVIGGAGGSRSPFQREVREWQRIDPHTGALFSGRLEADRWINGPLNSYGKKSSSSISSQSSNNSNLTTAAQAASNTHRSAGKISLHAIVGPESSSSSSPASSAVWAKQADLYGQLASGVGGSGGAGGAGGAAGADVAVAPPTQRRDLESFRHYNDDDDGDDDDLRLTARHQRRQQVSQSVYAPPLPSIGSALLQRSRSISTDDLSNDWEREDPAEQPVGEWRRVSKLRRSFQSQDHYKSPASSARPRPLDLPGNSVSVARLRAELENGRRLHTAMRNNHVDLAALDNILNTPSAKPAVAKRNTFLTAESLQEIRGKLKKLSDESLYKEDFLAYHQKKPVLVREISVEKIDPTPPTPSTPSAFRPVHNTHSLESRQRQKDTSSSEWHLRRKSYGFEKMSPPEDKSIFRVDASTDSGLGRSGEQLGNWSPTERERERNEKNASTALQQNGVGTIVHFGRSVKPIIPSSSPAEGELSKRHSIAVEETWRDVRKTSQVHVNGGTAVSSTSHTTTSHLSKGSAQKRVEFCKTEVHFAAESGRVNIVETDGKPPPTQNFRRRRRSTTNSTTTTTSGPLQSLVKSASAVGGGSSTSSTPSSEVTHFGDDSQRRKTIATSTVAYRATLMDPPEVVSQPTSSSSSSSSNQVTVTTVAKPVHESRYSLMESTSRNSYTSTSGVDTTDNETDELSNIRGILKNKPVKPKPYHLGENIESADVLWSVPAMRADRESPSARDSGITSDSPISPKSVAERIRIVEQRQQQQQSSPAGNGYSTKINVSLGSEDWAESGTAMHQHPSSKYRQHRRPSTQELLLEDLRQHQRILDEGLKSTSLIMRTMRSASEFDEAMRRLSIASIESALVQPTIVVPTPMLRSHSYQEEGSHSSSSRRPSTISTTSITSSDLFGSTLYDSLPRTPLAPPRLKLLGNTQIPVSQQLTQLRRLYDAAEQDQEDSADEEVKRYFRDSNSDSGGGTQGSSSPDQQPAVSFKGSEYSSSWSRLKAKRTIWKIEAQDQMLQRADLPKSNVMNIALHAPQIEKPKATPPTLRIGQLIPVAKPRTLFIQPQVQAQSTVDTADESGSESLKIVKEARGARKLREHELSYFGVQQQKQQQQQQTKLSTTTTTNPRRTLPSRSKVSHNDEVKANTTTTTKWQLLNDRPDLLRHSSPQHNDTANDDDDDDEDDLDEEEEHCYENIATELTTTFRVKSPAHSPERSRSPGSYERKTDLQRDAQILSEMTRNADQTLKALSDEAAIKDQRRRSCSLQRRSAKPLETIDEKVKVYPQSMGVARGTFASEARRNSRQSTPSPTRARSSSQSSIECCPRDRSRSSSRESMTHGGGSSDDQVATKQRAERLRMRTPKREKSRHEPIEVRVHRNSSKPRSSSSATGAGTSSLESKRSSHHSRHSREMDQSTETKNSSASRLIRSSRVADETRSRQSSHRDRETRSERDRERSRGTEKHRDELTRSRGHSSRSRHSEHPTSGTRESSRPSKTRSSRGSHDSATIHKKSTTSTTASSKASKTTVHKPTASASASATASASASTTTAPPTHHHELTHGKSTLNGHQHHQHHQHQHSSSGKHQGSGHGHREQQPHHVHSLASSTIASSRHPRDRHGKDRK
ncbi:uncharacterized protein LOC6542747 isoform X5 [Drosophila erecta]|uniref:uncharacterized protein LOC6542747 isoform X5 n=1 Tax=Drosophila erecta TaxID=7220 RepID=UPI000F0675D3|nr:uncharacterized protein LOC6542747 isoform X5 [Drosophila erecta]XP_026834264.1 uncharacterized protein LOC6542747 isoform X5 [Drosophila erecta]